MWFILEADVIHVLTWWCPLCLTEYMVVTPMFYRIHGGNTYVLHNTWWCPLCFTQYLVVPPMFYTIPGGAPYVLHNTWWCPLCFTQYMMMFPMFSSSKIQSLLTVLTVNLIVQFLPI